MAALQNAVSKYGISKIMKAARQELYNQPTNANSHIDLSNLLKLIDGLNEFDEA